METDLAMVEELAGLFFSPEEVTLIMGIASEQKSKEDFKRAFQKGKLKGIAAVRKCIFNLAVSGSSPAQGLALKIFEDSKLNEFNHE